MFHLQNLARKELILRKFTCKENKNLYYIVNNISVDVLATYDPPGALAAMILN